MTSSAKIGKNVIIRDGVQIGENVIIEDNAYIDIGAIIKDNTHIKESTFIGAYCVLGEFLYDFFGDKVNKVHPLIIGKNSIVRSHSVIYGDTIIGDNFQSGHRVTIREDNLIGNNVRIGTNTDIQNDCRIGNYVSIHSNGFLGQKTILKDYVWIFPNVTFTNDPTPPSKDFLGVTVSEYSVICAASILMPGVVINKKAVVGAGALVKNDVAEDDVVVGVPAKFICKSYDIKNKITKELAYPWMKSFSRGMPWENLGFDEWNNVREG